ncbi:MAG: response regulator [Leptolyngbyaceae cyanobacterium MO_188.B28]|nr:response regulator [Leptolyngbyaceae cyanobacterium MO_188.B28]
MATDKILLSIDDEESISQVIQIALEMMAGWTVLIAHSGVEGIMMAETQQPDVILLDVEMPVMDGLETLHKLQANPATQHIPVIFLTCKPDFVNHRQLGKLGAKAVIAKPFDPLTLAHRVEYALDGRK